MSETIEVIRPIHLTIHTSEPESFAEINSSDFRIIVESYWNKEEKPKPMVKVELIEDDVKRREIEVKLGNRVTVQINSKTIKRGRLEPNGAAIFTL